MQPAVFLDRDNTLIVNDGDLGDPARVKLKDGVGPGLRTLREAGFRLVIVTNQGGVARGVFDEDAVDAVHQRIAALVDEVAGSRHLIDRFYYCPYHPEAVLADYRRDHPWRKPSPGMLLQAARDLDLDLRSCWMVGDQARDMDAGRLAGCRTILVNPDPEVRATASATASVETFPDAVHVILDREPPRRRAEPPAPPLDGPPKGPPEPTPPPASLAPPPPTTPPPTTTTTPGGGDNEALADLRRAVLDLTEEMRSQRVRRLDFTSLRLTAGLCQLLAVLLAIVGILQWSVTDAYMKWMMGAILAQAVTLALLQPDQKG